MGTVSNALELAAIAIKNSDLPTSVKTGLLNNLEKINPAVDVLEEAIDSPTFNDVARGVVTGVIGETIAAAYVPAAVAYILPSLAALPPVGAALITGAIIIGAGVGIGLALDWAIGGVADDLAGLLRNILSDPLVLDLDGDGIELTSLASSATMFDLDDDGVAERTGWVGPHDGLLVHDANHNGLVDGVGELFGSANVDGYDELKTIDSNADGRIDANDAVFADLRVWRDLNSDGVSTSDELQTLIQAGITRLNLAYTQVDTDVSGNVVARKGGYVRADGTTRSMASVQFALDESGNLPVLPQGADFGNLGTLPNLPGMLALPDLRTAMFFDPALKSMVEDLVYCSHDFDTFVDFQNGGFLDVIYRWANVDTSIPLEPGDQPYYIQALAAFMGRPFDELNPHQIERLQDIWPALMKQFGAAFLVQASRAPYLDAVDGLNAALIALDPADPNYASLVSSAIQHAVAAGEAATPAYDYLDLFVGLRLHPLTGGISGDFNAVAARFIEDQPSFFFATMGGPGTGGVVIHPWFAWLHAQGSLLFNIADAMGIGADYVWNVTGWRWFGADLPDIDGTGGNDLMQSITAGRFYGYEGDDEIRGSSGVDSLLGGAGNDLLLGGAGSDMYVYSSMDGLDRITDTSGAEDAIFFSTELNATDLRVGRVAGTNDLLLHFGDPAAGITLTNQWASAAAAIEQLHFVAEDGLNAGDIASLYLATLATAGNDTINGSWASERIFGLDGADLLVGMGGDDSLDGGAGNDVLGGRDGNDVVLGGAGNDELWGDAGNDLLNGGSGNDYLTGGAGNDVYRYDAGGGDDTIWDKTLGARDNRLVFGEGIAPDDIRFSKGPELVDVRIGFASQPGSILIDNQWWSDAGIESIEFADGTVWTEAEIAARYVAAQTTSGDDIIWGSSHADAVLGGDGNDWINAWHGNDMIIGGRGDDRMEGGDGNDTYRYDAGDGHDLVDDYQGSRNNRLDFGATILPGDILFARGNTITDIKIMFAGQAGSILVKNQWWSDAGVESFAFADGTVWTDAEIAARYVAAQTTAGDDIVWGSSHGDAVLGGDGNDWINGWHGNDVITGGRGDDRMEGGDGGDTYSYALGDGHDHIDDYKGWRDNRLSFGAGISPESILFSRGASSSDIVIGFAGAAGSITIKNQWWGDAGVESIAFADGTIWTDAEIARRYVAAQGSAGDDIIWGSPYGDLVLGGDGNDWVNGFHGDDLIVGGLGNDRLEGSEGSDTYRYAVGDGDDIVLDYKGSRSNRIEFGAGIVRDDLIFSRVAEDGSDLRITFKNWAGSIVIDHQTWSDAGVELFVFADGGTLTEAQAVALIVPATNGNNALTGTAGDDAIWALEGADTISGLAGSDRLFGQDGNDTLIGGQGADTLSGGAGADVFRFGGGDSGLGAAADRIVDFAPGVDRIDLSAIDANPGLDADQAFTFIGQGAFTYAAGQLRSLSDGIDTWLQADLDGDGAADFEIVLTGTLAPLASDFML